MVQYLEKFSTTTGMWRLASSDQARRVTDWRSLEEGEEVGDSRAEGSTICDRGQAAISLTLDVDGTGSGSLLDSILSPLLKNLILCCLDSSSFCSHHR